MKKISLYACAVIAMLATVSLFTSCLGEEDKGPTQEQMLEAIANMKGQYSGSLKLGVSASYSNTSDDTLRLENVKWVANDSIVFENFPIYTLAKGVTDNDELKTALENYNQPFDLVARYYVVNPGATAYEFNFLMKNISLKLNYGGKDHELLFLFQLGYGVWKNQEAWLVMSPSALYLDGNNVSPTTNFLPMTYLFTGKTTNL